MSKLMPAKSYHISNEKKTIKSLSVAIWLKCNLLFMLSGYNLIEAFIYEFVKAHHDRKTMELIITYPITEGIFC